MNVEAPSGITKLVVARGAAAALIVAMPAALANSYLADQDPKPQGLLALSLGGVLLGFFLGGVLAGIEAPALPTRHGALAGFAAFVPVQLVAILGRLDRGDPVRPTGIIVIGLLAACVGTLGAQLGARRRARRNTT